MGTLSSSLPHAGQYPSMLLLVGRQRGIGDGGGGGGGGDYEVTSWCPGPIHIRPPARAIYGALSPSLDPLRDTLQWLPASSNGILVLNGTL